MGVLPRIRTCMVVGILVIAYGNRLATAREQLADQDAVAGWSHVFAASALAVGCDERVLRRMRRVRDEATLLVLDEEVEDGTLFFASPLQLLRPFVGGARPE